MSDVAQDVADSVEQRLSTVVDAYMLAIRRLADDHHLSAFDMVMASSVTTVCLIEAMEVREVRNICRGAAIDALIQGAVLKAGQRHGG